MGNGVGLFDGVAVPDGVQAPDGVQVPNGVKVPSFCFFAPVLNKAEGPLGLLFCVYARGYFADLGCPMSPEAGPLGVFIGLASGLRYVGNEHYSRYVGNGC